MSNLMVLPSNDPAHIRLVRVPPDYEGQEAFRHITGLSPPWKAEARTAPGRISPSTWNPKVMK
jgi:hypothetical protein